MWRKGNDAVVVFAGGDGSAEGIGDAGEAREVVVRGRIFQPEEVIVRDAGPHLDGLVHAPELVDVAHEIDVGPDGLAHDGHALDGGGHRGLAPALHLHLAEAHVHEPRPCLGEIVDGMRAQEGAAA